MSFWNNFQWNSPIGEIIDKEDVKLEEILDIDEVLSELKNQNTKLITFLAKPEILTKVFTYVTEPQKDLTDDKRYRYTYLCTEIICCEQHAIVESVLNNNLLEKLFAFLNQPAPIDSLLSNYFNKIAGSFLAKKESLVIDFLKNQPDFVNKIVSHIYSTPIMDFLIKLINAENNEVVSSWLADKQLIPTLIDLLSPESSLEINENVAQVLTSIVEIISQKDPKSELLISLNEKANIEKLTGQILKEHFSSSLLFGVPVLTALVQKGSSDVYSNATSDSFPTVLQVLLTSFPTLKRYLTTTPQGDLASTYGAAKAILGPHRLALLDLVEAIIFSRYFVIYQQAIKDELFLACFDLFFEFEWNNFVHTAVLDLTRIVLESNEEDIVLSFVEQTNLYARLATVGLSPVSDEASCRRGFMGHVSKIAEYLQKAAEVNEPLTQLLDKSEDWNNYIAQDFATARKAEQKPLGGPSTGANQSDDETKGFDELITNFWELPKKNFENDFPDSFVPNNDDQDFDILISTTDHRLFLGIDTDEEGFGDEFSDDEEGDD